MHAKPAPVVHPEVIATPPLDRGVSDGAAASETAEVTPSPPPPTAPPPTAPRLPPTPGAVPPAVGNRFAVRGRPRWATLAVGLVALLAGLVAFLPHRQAWVGHNGDHYYYASTALQYAGVGYEQSLRAAADYFHYPLPATQLDLGYLDPVVAPLIYPRVLLGLLALPAVSAWGIHGIWFPGVACGVASLLLLMVLAARRVGRLGLLAVPVLFGLTRYGPEFGFGIYQESLVILATTLMLLAFPLGGVRRGWWHVAAAAGLVPLMMLSRQVPLLPIGMAVGGWLWAWAGSRRLRNAWTPFVLIVPPVTVLSYGVLARWAPYDALPFLMSSTHSATVGELMQNLPAMWQHSLGTDWAELLRTDVPMIVVTAVGLIGLLLAVRNPLAGVFLGGLVSGVSTELLNGQPNSFRYLSASLPPLLLLAGLAVAAPIHLLPRLLGQRVRDWPGAALLRREEARAPGVVHVLDDGRILLVRPTSQPRPGYRWAGPLAAIASWVAVAAAVAGAVVMHPAARISGAPREYLSATTFPKVWPFTVQEGTLICAGEDYQMWFLTPTGERYALSGTAMATSMTSDSVLRLAPFRPRYGWPELTPMLTEGMKLCGADRAFQQPPNE